MKPTFTNLETQPAVISFMLAPTKLPGQPTPPGEFKVSVQYVLNYGGRDQDGNYVTLFSSPNKITSDKVLGFFSAEQWDAFVQFLVEEGALPEVTTPEKVNP